MQSPFQLSKIQTITGLAAIQGYISQSGEYTNDSYRKMPLNELCQITIDQVFVMIREATAENAVGNRQLIDALRINFQALSKRYENHTSIIGRNLTPQGMETIRKINRLFCVLDASEKILMRIEMANPVALQVDSLDEDLDDLVGEEWSQAAVLLRPMEQDQDDMGFLKRGLIDWTTKRSAEWLGIPLFSFANPSMETAWKIIPFLDFDQFSIVELKKIHQKFCNLEEPKRAEYWQAISAVLRQIGLALIDKGDESEGRRLTIEGYLMGVTQDPTRIQRAISYIVSERFPAEALPNAFSYVLLAYRAGLLDIETVPEELGINRWVLESLQSEAFNPTNDGSFALNAAVFVLRQCKIRGSVDEEADLAFYIALMSLSRFQDQYLEEPEQLRYEQPHHLYLVYDWYCNANDDSIGELNMICPHLIGFCAKATRDAEMIQASSLIRAFAFCRTRPDFTAKEKRRFIESVHTESCFPQRSVARGVQGLMKYSLKVQEALREQFPFVYALEVQATTYGDQNIINDPLHLSWQNPFASIAANPQAPIDLRLVFQYDISKMEIERSLMDVAALMLAAGRRIAEKFVRPEWYKWFSQYTLYLNHGFGNFSGRSQVNDDYFTRIRFHESCTKLDLTDTCVGPDTVFKICNHDRPLEIIYADHVTPGKRLLALNSGEYGLQYAGGVRYVHEALIKQVALIPPYLDGNDIDLFLEYCYTHQISNLTISSASQLMIKAYEQHWIGIGEYCLAYLIGSTNFNNLIDRWRQVQGHPALAPFRYFCTRLSVLEMSRPSFNDRPPQEKKEIKEIGIKIFDAQVDIPEPPAFVPVDFRPHLPENKMIRCDDETGVSVNLTFMSLHSEYFKRLLNFGGKDITDKGPLSLPGFSGQCIQSVVNFSHTGKLPEDMTNYSFVLELCSAAGYLEMPALKIALMALIKHRPYSEKGHPAHCLRKLAYIALGYEPELHEKDLMNLFKALQRYGFSHLVREFSQRLGIPEDLIQLLFQFALDHKPPVGLDLEQEKIFYQWVNQLNLSSWHLIV